MELAILCAGKGRRLSEVTQGKPKQMLKVGGKRIYDWHLELSDYLGLEPIVITTPKYEPYFREKHTKIITTTKLKGVIPTLYNARENLSENFCWIAGDMLFTDFGPLGNLLKEHLKEGNFASFFYAKNPKFKAKFVPSNPPEIVVGRDKTFQYSIPNFLVHSQRVFEYMEKEIMDNFLQRGIDAGEKVLFREYKAPVFEIDTSQNLNEARRHYEN